MQVQVFINSGSKVNARILGCILKLGLKIHLINIKVEKINSSILKTFEIVLISFQVEKKIERV